MGELWIGSQVAVDVPPRIMAIGPVPGSRAIRWHALQDAVDLTLTFRSFGNLNADASNVVLLPSYYTGNSSSYDRVIGAGCALDLACHFINFIDV